MQITELIGLACRAGPHRKFFPLSRTPCSAGFGYHAVIDAFISINAFWAFRCTHTRDFSIDACTLSSVIMIPGAAKWAAGKLGRSPIYRRFPTANQSVIPFRSAADFPRREPKSNNPQALLSQIRTCACHRGDPSLSLFLRPSPPGYSLSDEPLPYYVIFFLFFLPQKAHAVGSCV